ncbi:MAG TPA: ribosome-associated translation inhibitor RaiA [Lentisphaeria bacterium]|nr:MAG: ribosomal subunit interface protein [Lentisphaerae bacterium GWF2_38_69]HBM15523.1 ribosome-associated translation inhibitor RaiA [Lentisphaeria bacterium]
MSVTISVKNGNISETLKEYAQNKAAKLIEDFPRITTVTIVLDMQKTRSKAEIIVRAKQTDIEADAETYDMYESVDTIIEKAYAQLKKQHDKITEHRKA